MSEETELLRASLAGDRNAFERIVERYQSAVCAITFAGTGRVDVSEELAQETFLRAWANLRQLRDLDGFRFWLYSIARNALANHRRRQRPGSTETDLARETTDEAQDPSEILSREEERLLLEQAILRLPVKYREPLVLFYRQQQSIRESAQALGLSEVTFRTRVHRARKLLREQVAGRLEQTLKQTGPRQDFTKAVMVAIAGVPVGLVATGDAATGLSGSVAVTGGTSAVFTSLGAKVAVAAVIVVIGALVYTHLSYDTPHVLVPNGVQSVIDESPTAPSPGPADGRQRTPDESLSEQATNPVRSPELVAPDGPEVTATEEPEGPPEAMVPQTSVTGTVIDRNTLIPISGARVGFTRTETIATDSDGHFRLVYGESSTEALIYVASSGYASRTVALRVNMGMRQDIALTLQPGLVLSGKVVDPNRNPIGGATVRAGGLAFGTVEGTTNDQGEFRVDGVDPEDAYIHVSGMHPDFRTAFPPGVKAGRLGEEMFVDVVLAPRPSNPTVSGRVLNTRAEPVASATVGWMSEDIKTTTDQRGRYVLESPGRASSVLYVTHSECPMHVENVTWSPEETKIELDLRLEDAQVLSGRVIDDEGRPVSESMIAIASCGGQRVWGMAGLFHSDSDGRFTIPNAPAQEAYDLMIAGDGIHWTTYTVEAGEKECLIVVSRSGRIYGCVIDADTGHPIRCFNVCAQSGVGLPAQWTLCGYIFTSAEGHFDTGRLELDDGQPLALTVSADGYDPLTLDAVPIKVTGCEPKRTIFRLQRNEKRSTIHVGRVVDEDGQPVQEAEVGFRLIRETPNRRGLSRVLTDASGAYMISSIDPYEQIVCVRALGYAPYHARMSALPLDTPGVFADIVLHPPAIVFGHVWDENGQAVARVKVKSFAVNRTAEDFTLVSRIENMWPETRTDERGYYELSDVPLGETQISALFDDHRYMMPQTVTLNPGDSAELNFGNQGGFVVSGVVVEGAVGLERVDVQLKPLDRSVRSHFGWTDAAGRFKFLAVPEDEYVFAALRPQEAASEQAQDPNDQSHVLYEVMEIHTDLDLVVDYETRSIQKEHPVR